MAGRLAAPGGARALIFDLDGTLVDSHDAHYLAWREAASGFSRDIDRPTFDRLVGSSSRTIARELLPEGSEADIAAIVAAQVTHFAQRAVTVQPVAVVCELAERSYGDYALAIATNQFMGLANMMLRATGLMHLFAAMVTIDEVEAPKPAPDLFLECARRLEIPAGECHVFEDSRYGIEAAELAGMSATDVRSYL